MRDLLDPFLRDESAFDQDAVEEQRPQMMPADAGVPPTSEGARRSSADDVLDAVMGRKRIAKDLRLCTVCGSATKIRGNTLMMTTLTRRCTNRKCRTEFPVVSQQIRTAMPPVPPLQTIPGGPFTRGPNRGSTAPPPIDPNQPIHRRLSEIIRRVSDDE